jgi:hypothetical protein
VKPAQVAVFDQVVRMLVVSREADVSADVVQQRRILQPFALAVCQTLIAACLIEERQRSRAT